MSKRNLFSMGLLSELAVSVYEGGQWRRQSLPEAKEDGTCEAVTENQSWIRVRFRRKPKRNVTPREKTAEAGSAEMSLYHIEAEITPDRDGMITGMKLHIPLEKTLACSWKPHLSPLPGMTIGDKAFRSPVIVVENQTSRLALVPDLRVIGNERRIPYIMDYVQSDDSRELYCGMCEYEEEGHVYYRLTPKTKPIDRPLRCAFYLVFWEKSPGEPMRDFRKVEAFLWETFARENFVMGETPKRIISTLEHYPRYAYEWALDRWREVTWQQFAVNGRQVGGVVFIVTAKQKPGYGHEDHWREPKSLWNQAWFCGLRTAYGYWQAGHKYDRPDWVEKAELALEFALSAPQEDGLFPSCYKAGEDGAWEAGGWQMSSPRRPEGHENHVHLLDASWTCYWLLKWYKDLRKDDRILAFVKRYADRLLRLQREDGGFPAWVDPRTSAASPYLEESPETSMHVMLLCLLSEVEADDACLPYAEKAARYVLERIVPKGRWEDFETYWSCSKPWAGKQYGVKDARSGLYNQCNFGIYWTAEALLMLYERTGQCSWLDHGERVLAELSLYQQIWEPDYIAVPTLGGFGVMTSDDEWNDARQSLFTLTYYRYFRHTGKESYLARSMWALKASFYMMYCPENPRVMKLYNEVHPHLDERDYGFHMENFNHHDGTSTKGLGEFTIFDWGCGAAAASFFEYNRLLSDANDDIIPL